MEQYRYYVYKLKIITIHGICKIELHNLRKNKFKIGTHCFLVRGLASRYLSYTNSIYLHAHAYNTNVSINTSRIST